eukprot:5393698-Pleurochrysis_carterae.AAC.1
MRGRARQFTITCVVQQSICVRHARSNACARTSACPRTSARLLKVATGSASLRHTPYAMASAAAARYPEGNSLQLCYDFVDERRQSCKGLPA